MKILLLALSLIGPLCFGGISSNAATRNNQEQIVLRNVSSEAQAFIDLWRNKREVEHIEVCDMAKEDFEELYAVYKTLSTEDKEIVDKTSDLEGSEYTIKQGMTYLINKYFTPKRSNSDKKTLDQKTTIIIIVAVAIFGMSTISIFFVLKNGKIIK